MACKEKNRTVQMLGGSLYANIPAEMAKNIKIVEGDLVRIRQKGKKSVELEFL